MDLRWPAVAVAVAIAVVVVLVLGLLPPRRRRTPDDAALVAHLDAVRRLLRFRQLARRRTVTLAVQTAAVLVVLAGAATLAARPTSTRTEEPEKRNRDLVLCLDASSSMRVANAQVLTELDAVVAGLDGDRVGFAAFSGATLTIFPLTDDYEFARAELGRAQAAFGSGDPDYALGTQLDDSRGSQMGDGLASCTERFDRPGEERGRAIVLSTDMDPQGPPVYPLDEAAALAAERGIVVYAIGAELTDEGRTDLEAAVTSTGGRLFEVDGVQPDSDTVAGIIAGIERLEATRLEEPPKPVEVDRPGPATAVTAAGAVLVVLGGLLSGPGRRRRSTGGAA